MRPTCLSATVVERLATSFAAHLRIDLVIETSDGPVPVSGRPFPWEDGEGAARRAATTRWCEIALGFTPLDVVDLSDPAAGVRGLAFVLPHSSAARGTHRLYAKRMLVGDSVPDVLPDWAFFVRAVLDADGLGLTASRESLHDDEALQETRTRLGEQLKRWLLRMARTDRARADDFFRVHHLAAKAAATTDEDMLDVVAELLPWETTLGTMTLAEFSAVDRVVSYTDRVEDFQQVAAIARAEDIAVLNAGYAYDRLIVDRWVHRSPGLESRRLDPEQLADRFTAPTPQEEAAFAPLLDVARSVLGRARAVPVVRSFRPESLHAVLLVGRDADRERDRLDVAEAAQGPWADALDTLADAGCRAPLRAQRREPGGATAGRRRRRRPPAGGGRGAVQPGAARGAAPPDPLRQRARGPRAAGTDRPGHRRGLGMRQWDQVSEEFARVSVAADEAPLGWERVRAHEAALRLAQSDGSFAEEFVARTDLTQALYWTPKDPRTLVHFAWLRRALDPERGLVQEDRDAVLWRLKWAVDLIEDLPEVGLDALVAAIDDVEQVFRGDGYHLRPVHAARARLAQAVGDDAVAERELGAWLAEPRDSRSDCQACELREQARLVLASDPARALELVTPVVAGELTCGDEPRACLSIDAELRLDRGDVDGAVASFRRAWHLAQDDPGASDSVAACLRVLVRLGNTDRAVDLLLPRLSWLGELRTPRQRMWFAATAAFVLEQARDAGLAPESVDGRPVEELTTELRRTATGIAEAFDARYGSTVTSSTLLAAHDPTGVPSEPTLPPTRLPASPSGGRPADDAVPVSTGVLDRARVLRDGLTSAAADLEPQVRAWLRDREGILPVQTPQEWAAVSVLDRTAAQDAGGPERHRALLESAEAAAHRGEDPTALARAEGDLALLDAVEATAPEDLDAARSRAVACAERLEASGADADAGGLWRRIAWFGRPDDPAGTLVRAAAAYQRAGLEERRLLCAIEQAMATAPRDPQRATGILQSLRAEVAGTPLLASMALDGLARIARGTGDPEEAVRLLEQARAVPGVPRRARLAELAELCDVLVDQEAWADLEGPAADLVAAATEDRDPLLLAVGQRFLGLAYVETDRPVEAAELLEAALPVLRDQQPALVGPVGWALGNALLSLGQWAGARTAFAAASAAFEADGRLLEAGHAQWRAGNAAWDADDPTAAASHFDDAVDKARDSRTVGLYVEALRSRAALRADTGDLHRGIAELDGAIAEGERLAAEAGGEDQDEDQDFDGEVLEPHVLRQGAHLLARHGEVEAAVERLARAEALVGHDFELVLRAEAGIILADDDRLDEAEPRLRTSLAELHAAGVVATRVDAAGALARALDRAGRGDEAEEVWGRYGPQE